jgi:hypothetical protein
VRLAVCVLVSLVIISLLANTISVESLLTAFVTTRYTISQTLSERLTSTSAYPITQTISERLTSTSAYAITQSITERLTSYPAYPITQSITERLTSPYPVGGGVTYTINEYLLVRYNATTIPYNISYSVNETLPARPYTTTPAPPTTYTLTTVIPSYTITNPYKSGLTCNAVNPTRISDTLYQYNTSGLFYVLVNNSVTLTIYPDNYGQYQQVCQSLYYCGFRAYVSLTYSNKSLYLIIAIPQLPQHTIERYWSGVADSFELYLTEQTRDFSGIGSLIVWELHISIYSNNSVFTEQDIPLWSVFYESTNTLLPFPISIYSNNNNILVYDCSREWITAVCPSNNPLICAIWGFFKIIYDLLMNILPAPVRSVFSLFGVLGGVLTSVLTVFTNPLFLSIVLLLFPLLLLTLVTHETVERGGFGLINVFNELFNTIKHIVELIINMIKSVLPF